MSAREDHDWIRARALELRQGGVDIEYALTQAVQERVEWREEQARKTRQGRVHKPLRVTLGDLVKAKR